MITASASATAFEGDISKWLEIVPPPRKNPADLLAWSYAANYSPYDWRIRSESGHIIASSDTDPDAALKRAGLLFQPAAPGRHHIADVARVNDGWLVAFNDGEFGAALYWFSANGDTGRKISDDQIVQFLRVGGRLVATEGLAHMTLSSGALIELKRSTPQGTWKASELRKLPAAPYSASAEADGTLLIVVSDGLVSVDSNNELKILLAEPLWSGLYPTSSALDGSQQKLYVGMRQYVVEVELTSGKVRWLIPDESFINVLDADTEKAVRAQYHGL